MNNVSGIIAFVIRKRVESMTEGYRGYDQRSKRRDSVAFEEAHHNARDIMEYYIAVGVLDPVHSSEWGADPYALPFEIKLDQEKRDKFFRQQEGGRHA